MPVAKLPHISLNYLQLPRLLQGPAGEGEHLVLIHGLAASLGFWNARLMSPLREQCTVTAFDLRGHGKSDMPAEGYTPEAMCEDLDRLLDYLGIQRAHLLAHSFGGSVALHYAQHQPERVASLILADVRLQAIQPAQRLRDWAHWPQWQRQLKRFGIELDPDDPEGGYQVLVELARLSLERQEPLEGLPELFQRRAPNAKRRGSRSALRWLRLQEETSIRLEVRSGHGIQAADLGRIRQPVLGIYGELSMAIPSARALKRLVPDCHLHIVKNAGHFFPLSQPKRLIRPTLRFLEHVRKTAA